MKHMVLALIAVTVLAAVVVNCGGGIGTSSGKTLVTVNGKKITEGDIEFLGSINPRIQSQLATAAGKKRILDNLVEQELLYQEAVKKGVNRDSEVRAKAELYRRVIVAQSLLDKEIENAAKKYYDEYTDEFRKLALSHIMIRYEAPDAQKKNKKEKIRTEKEALELATEIKQRLDKGDDFAKLADQYSDDAATKKRGGELGLVAKDDARFKARGYDPLVEKAFELSVGETSGPIKTEKGYHVIVVTRGAELEPFEDVKNAILFKTRNDVRNTLLARIKKDGKVTFADELAPKVAPKPEATETTEEAASAGEASPTEMLDEPKQ